MQVVNPLISFFAGYSKKAITIIALIILVCSCGRSGETGNKPNKTPILNFQYLKHYPHDTLSFTEGLEFHKGKLYESTAATHDFPGTRSLFGEVDLKNGQIVPRAELNGDQYFGEGITFLNGKIFQLTYKNRVGFIYDDSTFKRIGEFNFKNSEGWGMTSDGKDLIMSDGTYTLTYLDANNQKMVRTLTVTENGVAIPSLNELEYIDGYIYANIWMTNTVVKMSAATGEVVAKFDFSTLANDAKETHPRALEMNGIAYDAKSRELVVTGKFWPKMYVVKIPNSH